MGIENHAARFLIACRKLGTDFEQTATLGHQYFWADAGFVNNVCRETALEPPPNSVFAEQYADSFLRWLGAGTVDSVDASQYENASVIWDMNSPVSLDLHGRYSAVLDIGTLEHVFNFPTAIANCMSMLRVGGHFISVCPANNFLGHGFYQFSPELFYRVFSPENGFCLKRMVFAEVNGAQWFEVSDPMKVGSRVELVNSRKSYLMVCAQKLEQRKIFETAPQQSDYAAIWSGGPAATRQYDVVRFKTRIKPQLRRLIPSFFLRAYEEYSLRFTRALFAPPVAFNPTTTLGKDQ